jgi:hypothetical protein
MSISAKHTWLRRLIRSAAPLITVAMLAQTVPLFCGSAGDGPLSLLVSLPLLLAPGAVGVDFRWQVGFEDRVQHQHRCCHVREPDAGKSACPVRWNWAGYPWGWGWGVPWGWGGGSR